MYITLWAAVESNPFEMKTDMSSKTLRLVYLLCKQNSNRNEYCRFPGVLLAFYLYKIFTPVRAGMESTCACSTCAFMCYFLCERKTQEWCERFQQKEDFVGVRSTLSPKQHTVT